MTGPFVGPYDRLASPIARARETGPLFPLPTGRDVAWTVLCGLGLMSMGAIGGTVLGVAAHADRYAGLLAAVMAAAAGCAGLSIVLIIRRRWTFADMGFRRPERNLWHLLWQAPILVAALWIALFALAKLAGIGDVEESEGRGFGLGPAWGVLVVLVAAVVFPAVEEIVFRRVLLDWLMTKMSTRTGSILAVALFAVCHFIPGFMVYAALLGSVLVGLRLWYRTLWAPFIVHALNNAAFTTIVVTGIAT